MQTRSRQIIAVIGGLFTAGAATQMVSWQLIPRACLAAGVSMIAFLILSVALPKGNHA
jgi:hypothetical protein